MLREEVEQYTNLTGEDGWHVPIIKVGAYLDGYNKGVEVLDKIRAEIDRALSEEVISDNRQQISDVGIGLELALSIIDKYKAESEE